MKYQDIITESMGFLSRYISSAPAFCIVLGTGLGGIARAMNVDFEWSYGEIPHFPRSTSPSHMGKLLVGSINDVPVAVFQGRFHHYEGYSAQELTIPVRVMGLMGVKRYIGCNAAGGLNLNLASGDLMLIRDHINLIPDNPLRGPNVDAWGERFPDMSRAYSARFIQMLKKSAEELCIPLREGIFVAVPGPSLETPAETRFLRMIGGDAVAMSLVPEVIAAVHMGMEVVGISVIANVNDPDNFQPISIEDVIKNAQRANDSLTRLLVHFISGVDNWKV
ncbi:MAG: purine-nucleoside phosphorylase [Dissulfuribacterales bacterium]